MRWVVFVNDCSLFKKLHGYTIGNDNNLRQSGALVPPPTYDFCTNVPKYKPCHWHVTLCILNTFMLHWWPTKSHKD